MQFDELNDTLINNAVTEKKLWKYWKYKAVNGETRPFGLPHKENEKHLQKYRRYMKHGYNKITIQTRNNQDLRRQKYEKVELQIKMLSCL